MHNGKPGSKSKSKSENVGETVSFGRGEFVLNRSAIGSRGQVIICYSVGLSTEKKASEVKKVIGRDR